MPPEKADIRHRAFKRRDGIDRDLQARFAERLAAMGVHLVRQAAPGPDPTVALYAPIGSEPDVRPMAEALDAAGIALGLPVDWSTGTPLVYRRWIPGDRLAAGPLGIGEPLEDADEVDPDIVFTPMAAFDRRGHRVGYGAGNVDRTLAALRARQPVTVIGIAFAIQEEPEIPSEPHDEPLDLVVTDFELIRCRS